MNDGLTYEGIVFDSFVKSPYMNQKGIGPRGERSEPKGKHPDRLRRESRAFICRIYQKII